MAATELVTTEVICQEWRHEAVSAPGEVGDGTREVSLAIIEEGRQLVW